MLTKSRNKIIQPKHSKGGSVFEFFPIFKAQQNNNRGNFFLELDLTQPRDKYEN